MKKIYFAIALIAATFCLSPMTASAQDPEPEDNGVFLDKYVTGPDANGQYLITLESYATGQTVKTESEIMPPVNIIMLIDVSKAMHTNQLPEPLSLAVEDFIVGIPKPTDPTKSHNISVFTFDERIEHEWHNVNDNTAHTIQQTIASFGTKGTLFSQPEYAFEKAITEAQAFQKDAQAKDNQTMVIFFTSTRRLESGELGWYDESAQSTVNLAYVLKHKGALPDGHKSIDMYGPIPKKGGTGQKVKTLNYAEGLNCKVFAIANYKPTKTARDGEENEVMHFLNYTSSLYPDKWVSNFSDFTTSSEGMEEPNTTNYHLFSPDKDQIGELFRTVEEEITQPTIPIDATSIVRDILTPDFQLPEGVSLTAGVKVYTQDCVYSGAPNYTISFKEQRNEITDKVTVSVGGNENRTIEVVGFDFAEHYCGYDEIQKVKTPHEGGQKLVITIPIETAADYQGGYDVPTNASGSGIYPADSEQPLEEFDVPSVDFPSIGIIKNGLKVGESATFTVQRTKDEKGTDVTENPFNIILTCTETGKPAYVILKNLKEGTYRVAESTWSWTYEVTEVTIKDGDDTSTITPSGNEATVSTQVLAESQTEEWPTGIDETVKCVLFTFTNAKKTGDDNTIYAESVVKNKFIGGSSSSASATTINSKDQN